MTFQTIEKNLGFVVNRHCSITYSVPSIIDFPDDLKDISTFTVIKAKIMLNISHCDGAKDVSSEWNLCESLSGSESQNKRFLPTMTRRENV